MKHLFTFGICSILLFLSACTLKEKEIITFGTLIEELADRDRIAKFPKPYYNCKQFSSYDRESVKPGDVSWFANSDRSMFIRTENNEGHQEYVMMDTEGPGAIVRLWMTFAGPDCGKGILRIYLDGEKEAVIEGTALDIISGGTLVPPPLSTSVSDLTLYTNRGHNLYLPIPYAKHCKVTYESNNIKDPGAKTGGECVYYNINYRSYAPETKVKTFTMKDLDDYRKSIVFTQKALRHRTVELPEGSCTERMGTNVSIASKETFTYNLKASNAAVRKLIFRISAKNIEQALRNTMLSITFDDNKTIECPIGYFFGTGYKINSSHTWYGRVDIEGSMASYWIMPFKNKCSIEVTNTDTQDIHIAEAEVTYSAYSWDNNTMYFHADWKESKNMGIGQRSEGAFDYNYLTTTGKGVYVGDALTVYNRVDAWWGEGDEKIYVDGEEFPSHFGTGTEDYYGYAWCRPEIISNHPFIAQPTGNGNFHPGYTVNIRYRGLDAIPYNKSLKFDMEVWHWVKSELDFIPVTFRYEVPKQ